MVGVTILVLSASSFALSLQAPSMSEGDTHLPSRFIKIHQGSSMIIKGHQGSSRERTAARRCARRSVDAASSAALV
jgi:hypothetical protein